MPDRQGCSAVSYSGGFRKNLDFHHRPDTCAWTSMACNQPKVTQMKTGFLMAAAAATLMTLAGCSSPPTNAQIGTATGAVIGGAAGSALGGGTLGTVGGAAAGAVIGNEIGKRQDQKR